MIPTAPENQREQLKTLPFSALLLAPFLATLPFFVPNTRLIRDVCGTPSTFGFVPLAMMVSCLAVSCFFILSHRTNNTWVHNPTRWKLASAVLYIIGHVLLWVVIYLYPDVPIVGLSFIGAILGICIPPLFIAWMDQCPADFRTALIGGSIIAILTALLNAVFSLFSPGILTAAWFTCCIVGTLAPFLLSKEHAEPVDTDPAHADAPISNSGLSELLSALWVPLLGLIVCMLGTCIGDQTVDDVAVSGEYIGLGFAAAISLFICFAKTDTPLVPLIDKVAIPSLMAISIFIGALATITSDITIVAASLVFVPVALAALYAVASVMAIQGYSRVLVAGTTLAACCIAMLIGSALSASQDIVNTGPIFRLITYAYYCIVFIYLGCTSLRLMTKYAPHEETEQEELELIEEARKKRLCELSESHGLTGREREVFDLLSLGYKSESISHTLLISSNTVRTHMKNIYRKLNIGSHEELLLLVNDQNISK